MRIRQASQNERFWHQTWLVLVVLLLSACQTLQPAPTPTATRTPVVPTSTPTPTLTPTPTATPTMTPSPTPTIPPDLWLPPDAVQPAACPPAPAELLFLRDRELWICAEAGGTPTEVLHDEASLGDIVEFWVASDGRVVLLLTQEGVLYAFDREVGDLTLIPTVGGQLESSYGTWVVPNSEGTDVLYLAWGVQPDRGPAARAEGSATLVQGSFDDPRAPHRAVAYCEGNPERPCRGFWLSPDGTAAVLGDRHGFWYIFGSPPMGRLQC